MACVYLHTASKFTPTSIGPDQDLKLAKELGYTSDDLHGSKKYLAALSQELKKLVKSTITLQNLSKLKTDDLFDIFSNEQIYSSPNLKNCLLHLNLEIVKPIDPEVWKKGGQALIKATTASDFQVIEMLLKHYADPNFSTDHGSRPLHLAKTVEIAKLLLDHNALIHALGVTQMTPLHSAVIHENSSPLVEFLLKEGADPDIPDANGSFPFHSAVIQGNIQNLELLLKKSNKSINAKIKIKEEEVTALYWVCNQEKENIEILQCLLRHGANPNIPTSKDLYPLHLAATRGHEKTVAALLESGATINQQGGENGFTPLCVACGGDITLGRIYRKNFKVVELLLEKGANPNISNLKFQESPLQYAAAWGSLDVVILLHTKNANLNHQNFEGLTTLHYTTIFQGIETEAVMVYLVQKGADLNILTMHGLSVLDCARDKWVGPSFTNYIVGKGAKSGSEIKKHLELKAKKAQEVNPHDSIKEL